jgi:hypothetical protein
MPGYYLEAAEYLDFHCLLLSQHRRQKAAFVSQVGQVYFGDWVIFTSALTFFNSIKVQRSFPQPIPRRTNITLQAGWCSNRDPFGVNQIGQDFESFSHCNIVRPISLILDRDTTCGLKQGNTRIPLARALFG